MDISQPLYGQAAVDAGDRLRMRHAAQKALLRVVAEQFDRGDSTRGVTDTDRLAVLHDLTGGWGPLWVMLLAAAPEIDRTMTAGEYALILRRAAGA